MPAPSNEPDREDQAPLVQFTGAWEKHEKERLRAALEQVEQNLSPIAQLTMSGAWEARCFDGGAYYGLHRDGGPLILGSSLQELIDRLPTSDRG